eukprot:UN05644
MQPTYQCWKQTSQPNDVQDRMKHKIDFTIRTFPARDTVQQLFHCRSTTWVGTYDYYNGGFAVPQILIQADGQMTFRYSTNNNAWYTITFGDPTWLKKSIKYVEPILANPVMEWGHTYEYTGVPSIKAGKYYILELEIVISERRLNLDLSYFEPADLSFNALYQEHEIVAEYEGAFWTPQQLQAPDNFECYLGGDEFWPSVDTETHTLTVVHFYSDW